LRYGIILWRGTGESIKLWYNEIWHDSVRRDRRKHQIILYEIWHYTAGRDRKKHEIIVY
jgi:hypothetical protein